MPRREYAFRDAERADDAPVMAMLEPFIGRRLLWTTSEPLPDGSAVARRLLLPPSLREWLPEGHLAWFVIDAVAQLHLGMFYAAYRADGHGRPAHDPAMMVAMLLYGYAIGERSSRRLERRYVEDVATRVICANQAPDHTTIARFSPAT